MTRQELLDAFDNLILREKDYRTLLNLVENASPKLFTKIYEEILLGNMYLQDFEPIFPESTSNYIASKIESQDKIYKQYINMYNLRQQANNNLAIDKFYTDEQRILNNTDSDETAFDKKTFAGNLISSLDSTFQTELMLSLYDKLKTDPDLLIVTPNLNYYINLNYDDIELDNYDRAYMETHNTTVEQMKKIKSLANYMKFKNKQKQTSAETENKGSE